MITAALFVVAAAAGTVSRAWAGERLNRPGGIPYGTLAVNVVGSLLLGLLWNVGPPTTTVLGVGALGTFTTFSSFAHDLVALTERRRALLAVGYLTASCAASVGAAAVGVALVT